MKIAPYVLFLTTLNVSSLVAPVAGLFLFPEFGILNQRFNVCLGGEDNEVNIINYALILVVYQWITDWKPGFCESSSSPPDLEIAKACAEDSGAASLNDLELLDGFYESFPATDPLLLCKFFRAMSVSDAFNDALAVLDMIANDNCVAGENDIDISSSSNPTAVIVFCPAANISLESRIDIQLGDGGSALFLCPTADCTVKRTTATPFGLVRLVHQQTGFELQEFGAFGITWKGGNAVGEDPDGGALDLRLVASLWLWNCQFLGNSAARTGGAVSLSSSEGDKTWWLRDCQFLNNAGFAAFSFRSGAGEENLEIDSCNFAGNTVSSSSSVSRDRMVHASRHGLGHRQYVFLLTVPYNCFFAG